MLSLRMAHVLHADRLAHAGNESILDDDPRVRSINPVLFERRVMMPYFAILFPM